MKKEGVDRKDEAPAVHMNEREAALIRAIRGGDDPAALLELAIREVISRLPPEQRE